MYIVQCECVHAPIAMLDAYQPPHRLTPSNRMDHYLLASCLSLSTNFLAQQFLVVHHGDGL